MAGAIIENTSTKRLVLFGSFILLFQVLSILVGGLIAPSPTRAIHYRAAKCINRHRAGAWFTPWGPERCRQLRSFDEPLAKTLDANDVVFAVHMPLPSMQMSPWFQYVLAVMQLDIAFRMINQIEDDVITIDAGLASRDDLESEWTSEFHSVEEKPLRCSFAVPKIYENEGRFYHCDPVPFMELGCVAHKYFLINIRLPVNDTVNVGVGEIKDIHVVGIHQNGGFTKVWISMKTVFGPWIFGTTAWYWRRISLMARPPVLLEKVILALGASMTFLNVPLEWLSLGFEWTWMLLLEDVRQGVFYATLFCFWIIFCGEHLMDQCRRNRVAAYWRQLGLVVLGSSVLLVFDLCERGIHLSNPFYSIWALRFGTKVVTALMAVAAAAVCLYFLCLCRMVADVFRNIGEKVQQLPAMPEARRRRYKGIIYRFKFLMLVTLACAAMTVVSFILTQASDGPWRWRGYTLQLHSAFLTGMYGMWNLYVFAIVLLYAPARRRGAGGPGGGPGGGPRSDVPEKMQPTEAYRITGKVAEE